MNYRLTPKMKSAAKKILIFVYPTRSTISLQQSKQTRLGSSTNLSEPRTKHVVISLTTEIEKFTFLHQPIEATTLETLSVLFNHFSLHAKKEARNNKKREEG